MRRALFAAILLAASAYAQPKPAKAAAPVDLTGYWVSIVTEDWRFRMITPGKGDFPGVPLNDAAKKIADAWDPAKDEAAGQQCKSPGAIFFAAVALKNWRALLKPSGYWICLVVFLLALGLYFGLGRSMTLAWWAD